MDSIVAIFKALSDSARLRIVNLFVRTRKEICSCEICDSLVEPQYAVSRNMKILKHAGLLKERKEGKWVYYSLNDQSKKFYQMFYEALKFLPDSDQIFGKDVERFKKRMTLREGGKCLIGVQNKELLS